MSVTVVNVSVMPDVAYKDLCLDANRPDLVAPFWAPLLGLTAHRQASGDYQLEGAAPVWVNTVAEPLTAKSRVHLDLRFPDRVFPAGTVVRAEDDDIHWTVMSDPDGLVFCAFGPHPRHPEAPAGPFELVVDAVDPLAVATWWAERTGGTVHQREDGPWAWIEGAAGFPYMFWVFNPVPEPKLVKNRVHWDVTLTDATVEDLAAAGASVLRAPDDDISWTVMADPEGNEFCAFEAPS